MLTIRHAQMHTLAQAPRERFIDEMLVHLYDHFPTVSWLLTREELRQRVNATIMRAAVYQLTSRQQVCRFLNLAASYGWEFDTDPELNWMRRILTDASLIQPGERLDRLVQTCLHRQEIEAHNLALREQSGLLPVADASAADAEVAEDYAGHELDPNTQTTAASTEELLARNPLGYHLSRSLWDSQEEAMASPSRQTTPTWVTDTAPLLRQKTGVRHVVES